VNCLSCKNRTCFIQNNFSAKQISEISKIKSVVKFKKGDLLYKKGSKPKSAYILLEGCLEIIKKDNNGGKKDFYFVEPGELFGYRSLLTEEIHNTTAKIYKNSKICIFDKEDFFELFISTKGFAKKFMKFLSDQLKRRQKRLEEKTKN
jgi:CRP/FNR family transcriptional regulator, polysaccharide utilization system transcription regulator